MNMFVSVLYPMYTEKQELLLLPLRFDNPLSALLSIFHVFYYILHLDEIFLVLREDASAAVAHHAFHDAGDFASSLFVGCDFPY